jgi:hypothetical protein
MCFGKAPAATITMPNTGSYDRMAQMQMDAMRQQQEGVAMLKQMELNQALRGQEQSLMEYRDFKTERANDTAANAQRMAALIGTPPPEKTAKAPVVGTDRENMVKAKGKKGLRIDRVDRPTATSEGAGTGLNITTGS